ncbi:hypothetical protein G9A89_012548 [Geosiphon pyriformis]|nr:hypothetical protein G9A89_012548 [Geosiphon pyriformis]
MPKPTRTQPKRAQKTQKTQTTQTKGKATRGRPKRQLASESNKKQKKEASEPVAKKIKKNEREDLLAIPELPTETGGILVVGGGECGQLGIGEWSERQKITGIKFLQDKEIVDIAVGPLHNVAINRQGKMYTWGCNDHGALGRVTDDEDERRPGLADDREINDVKIVKVACGGSLTLALSDEGKVYATGTFKGSKLLGLLHQINFILLNALTLSEDGIIGYSRGQPKHQQFRFSLYQPASKLKKVVDIAAGLNHAVLLTSEGYVYTFGSSEQWQLARRGSPRFPSLTLFPEIAGQLKNVVIKKIGCGNFHTLAADEEGHIYAWGLNNARQCLIDEGDHVKVPTEIPFFEGSPVKQLAGGLHHSVVLLENGKVYTFGGKENGKLGIGGDQESNKGYLKVEELAPLKFDTTKPITSISVGDFHNIALTDDGQVFTWGDNVSYQLANESEDIEYAPCYVDSHRFENEYFIKAIGAGSQHSVFFGLKREKNDSSNT